MVVFGQRLFGKVDQVPGLGHVATKFFHIDYVPLIPYEGWLVFQQNGKTWRGVRIPLSMKSLLVAWSRMLTVTMGVAGVLFLVVFLTTGRTTIQDVGIPAVAAVAGLGGYILTRKYKGITHASFARACQLGKLAKLNEKGMAAIAAAYGQAPPTFGFQPLPAKAAPIVDAEIVEDEEVESDLGQIPDEPRLPARSADDSGSAKQPLRETRRHG